MPIGGHGRLPVAPVEPAIDAIERGIAALAADRLAALGRRRAADPDARPAPGRAPGPRPDRQGAGHRAHGGGAADDAASRSACGESDSPRGRSWWPLPSPPRPLGQPRPAVHRLRRRVAADDAHRRRRRSRRGPTIVEFSPYGRDSETFTPAPAYNCLLVQIRGTGDSDGRFDALGPRTQRTSPRCCAGPAASRGATATLGLNGFSASAITIYNSLHLPLPCVKAAVLKSGTLRALPRPALSRAAINNTGPGLGVLALIGAPALAQGRPAAARAGVLARHRRRACSGPGSTRLQHPTLDDWWRERGFRGDVNHLPILMIDGFFDVESRGAFQAFQQLRGDGAHLVVVGAHDGAPAGTDGGAGDAQAWFDHYLRGVDNGVESQPARAALARRRRPRGRPGGRSSSATTAGDWPIPGTRWPSLALDPAPRAAPRTRSTTEPLGGLIGITIHLLENLSFERGGSLEGSDGCINRCRVWVYVPLEAQVLQKMDRNPD